MRRQEPGVLVAARIANAGGVVIGYGDGEMFVASDLPAIVGHTQRVVFLEDGEVARVTATGATYSRLDGEPHRQDSRRRWRSAPSSPARASTSTTWRRRSPSSRRPSSTRSAAPSSSTRRPWTCRDLNLTDADIAAIERVVLIGMGTSFHAAMIGRTYIEQLAGLPAEVDNASEYRYRQPILDASTLVIAVGQSGETVDTLAAMHEARQHGAKVVAVCNTPGSQATRVADGTVFMRCGPEIAVASTKTFLGSLTALYLLACHLGERRGFLDARRSATR